MNAIDHLKNPSFSSFLDLARWVAAWIVCIGHLRNPLFFGFGAIGEAAQNPLIVAWYFVTGWYGEAVIVFFVLSGYLVGGLGIAKFAANTFNPAHYGIDRVSRLYVAFLPSLILTAALDITGMHYFGAAGLYDGTQAMFAEKLGEAAFAEAVTATTFLGNLAMLQTFRFDSFGTNSPLWTISAEFWFYVAFGAVLACLIAVRSKLGQIAALLAVGIALLWLLTPTFLYYLGLWLVGLGVAALPSSKARWPILFAILFAALLVVTRLKGDALSAIAFGQTIRDYSVAIGFALVLHAMRDNQSAILARMAQFNKWLADFSFSIYLIHFPVMIFVLSALYWTGNFPEIRTGYAPTDLTGIMIYGGIIALLFAVSWAFAQCTEQQTWKIRRFLKTRFAS
ncbi:acyltransferase family protein [Pontixanthobacter aquaemixtae]|uniref:Acyltransferase family protein n=1 Tax=Pontixanthobacter aquaemixtae TaxID=1958940 RepID=A0A844ZVS0_9SPHN|nr:acyltransferase [Pontixanthobacter aquaemixtae]MXO91362.1 acyltransferase family protein [Pontixanthobacter aquaemixtae]